MTDRVRDRTMPVSSPRRLRFQHLTITVVAGLLLASPVAVGAGTASSTPSAQTCADCLPPGRDVHADDALSRSQTTANASPGTEAVYVYQIQCQYRTDDLGIQYYSFQVERQQDRRRDTRAAGERDVTIYVSQLQCQFQNTTGAEQIQQQTLFLDIRQGSGDEEVHRSREKAAWRHARIPDPPPDQRQAHSQYLQISVADRDPAVVVTQRSIQIQSGGCEQVQRQEQMLNIHTGENQTVETTTQRILSG